MKSLSIWGFTILFVALAQACPAVASANQQAAIESLFQGEEAESLRSQRIRTVDHFVRHISTVPANRGETVRLFVRERVQGDLHHGHQRPRPVVLMIHGATESVISGFDLRFENYSWMAYLAAAGFDVFAMDHTGYGLSPRPLMDNPCNTTRAAQQALLIPNPLSAPCDPNYPFTLTNMQSDWDEIDTVVNYLRRKRGVRRVSLVGWSRSGVRIGGYAAQHPEKVEKLLFYSPRYNRLDPTAPPNALPERGVPTALLAVNDFTDWDLQAKCES